MFFETNEITLQKKSSTIDTIFKTAISNKRKSLEMITSIKKKATQKPLGEEIEEVL